MIRRSLGQMRLIASLWMLAAVFATATALVPLPVQAVPQPPPQDAKKAEAPQAVPPPPQKIMEMKKTDEPKKDVQKNETPKADGGKKVAVEEGIPGEVEINFYNGSTVRMIIESEKLDIATPYGKLSVPVKHLRAIEFGLHFPPGMAAKIDQAVKNLSSNNYRERETASNTLLAPYSYMAVFEATQAKELELATRAKEIVKKLAAKHGKKDLKTTADDKIVTPTFTIVGQILTPTVKVKTDYFGEAELSVARMRTLRAIGGPTLHIEVTLDGGRYCSPGQWLETEFVVDGRLAIEITAHGMVDLFPQNGGNQVSGPNGWQAQNQGGGIRRVGAGGIAPGQKIPIINNNTHGGMLIGKVGRNGDPFFIGDHFDDTLTTEGPLFLHIGPSPWNQQCTGSYDVKISRKS